MSNIGFHFDNGDYLRMSGAERAWMGMFVHRQFLLAIETKLPPLGKRLSPYAGIHLEEFATMLNTALAVSNEAGRLMTHIHGRCETHMLITPDAFGPVADAFELGMRVGLIRDQAQIRYKTPQQIAERFKAGGRWCVLDYSVTDSFPPARKRTCDDDEDAEMEIMEPEEAAAILAETNFLNSDELADPRPQYGTKKSVWTMTEAEVVEMCDRREWWIPQR